MLHRFGAVKRPYNVDCLFCTQEKDEDGFCASCLNDPKRWWTDLQRKDEEFPIDEQELEELHADAKRAFQVENQQKMHGHPLQSDQFDFRLLELITDERNKYEANRLEDQRQEMERKSKVQKTQAMRYKHG